jgi:hypothetical protein
MDIRVVDNACWLVVVRTDKPKNENAVGKWNIVFVLLPFGYQSCARTDEGS